MKLEQQAFKIQDIMYDSMTKHNFDSVSDAVDRVSDTVDSNLDKVDTNSIKLTYDNASDTNTGSTNMIRIRKVHPRTLTQKTTYKMTDMITL